RPVQSRLEPLRHRPLARQCDRPRRRHRLAHAGRAHSLRSHCQRLPRACRSAEGVPQSTTRCAEPIADARANGVADDDRIVDPIASHRRGADGRSSARLELRVFGVLPILWLVSGAAWSHSFGTVYNLPVPFWMYAYGATATLVVSFALV